MPSPSSNTERSLWLVVFESLCAGRGERGDAIAETTVSRSSRFPTKQLEGFERFPFADKSRAILQPNRVKMCTRSASFFFFFYVISIIYPYVCVTVVREKRKISSRDPRSRNLISIVVDKDKWTSFRISMTDEGTDDSFSLSRLCN